MMRFRRPQAESYEVIPSDDTESTTQSEAWSDDGRSDHSSRIGPEPSCFDTVSGPALLVNKYPMYALTLRFTEPDTEKAYQDGTNATVLWRIYCIAVIYTIFPLFLVVFPFVEELRLFYAGLALFSAAVFAILFFQAELRSSVDAKVMACRALVALSLLMQIVEEVVEIRKSDDHDVCPAKVSELHIFTFASVTTLLKVLCVSFSDALIFFGLTSLYYGSLHTFLASPCLSPTTAFCVIALIVFQFYISEKAVRVQFCSYHETSSKELKHRMKSALHYKKSALIQNQFIGIYFLLLLSSFVGLLGLCRYLLFFCFFFLTVLMLKYYSCFSTFRALCPASSSFALTLCPSPRLSL